MYNFANIKTNKMNDIIIYTDGAAKGNPGVGGYGAILIWGEHKKSLSQGYKLTTNNRMELLAVIVALEALKKDNCSVQIYSDSKYVVDAINKGWLESWQKTNFKKKKNVDLWKRFLKVYKKHNVTFNWVKGHNNIEYNELADQLAVSASEQPNLLTDEGYINEETNLL